MAEQRDLGLLFNCPYYPECDHSISIHQKSNMRSHLRSKHGEGKLSCPEDSCDYETVDNANLTRHRQNKHGYEPIRRAERDDGGDRPAKRVKTSHKIAQGSISPPESTGLDNLPLPPTLAAPAVHFAPLPVYPNSESEYHYATTATPFGGADIPRAAMHRNTRPPLPFRQSDSNMVTTSGAIATNAPLVQQIHHFGTPGPAFHSNVPDAPQFIDTWPMTYTGHASSYPFEPENVSQPAAPPVYEDGAWTGAGTVVIPQPQKWIDPQSQWQLFAPQGPHDGFGPPCTVAPEDFFRNAYLTSPFVELPATAMGSGLPSSSRQSALLVARATPVPGHDARATPSPHLAQLSGNATESDESLVAFLATISDTRPAGSHWQQPEVPQESEFPEYHDLAATAETLPSATHTGLHHLDDAHYLWRAGPGGDYGVGDITSGDQIPAVRLQGGVY
ncbi:hypothetical protein MIND_01160800 [Mycena indigotica]|uniref:C2H2-type domain-containing protein n=1 Tax=Mycena indigotica TaxID=2126181 RepID=A0A8H6VYB0_9AGAR|nr:uncharacterized protein MIND_01160800 [Mycena indigotica]KAF7292629.1 hypothetical protein MIND_01160800 [Mycena indigotica]